MYTMCRGGWGQNCPNFIAPHIYPLVNPPPFLFADLKFHVAVCTDAVRANRLTSKATDDEVERVVRDWLRTAPDRSGGRRKREKKLREHSNDNLTKKSRLSASAAAANDEDVEDDDDDDDDVNDNDDDDGIDELDLSKSVNH